MNTRIPCVISLIRIAPKYGQCGICNTATNIIAELWYDSILKEMLVRQGMNEEKATLIAMGKSIKHQQKNNSTPYMSQYVCTNHLMIAMKIWLNNEDDIVLLDVAMLSLNPNTSIIILDRNESEEETYPSIVGYSNPDLHDFLKHYPDKMIRFNIGKN